MPLIDPSADRCEYAPDDVHAIKIRQARKRPPGAQQMNDSQGKITSPTHPSVGSKSSFDVAEYHRWAENVRKKYGGTNEENQFPQLDPRSWLAGAQAQKKN